MNVNLVMFKDSGDRRDFTLSSPVTTIGRKDDCDIRIPLVEVSRHHAQLTIEDSALVLKDLDSANGTFVNNRRVKEHTLAPGDHLIVGPVVFTVQVDGVPEQIRAVKTKLRRIPAASGAKPSAAESAKADHVYERDEEFDPISALEALASSADQTAIDPFDDEDEEVG
jgi:pSer/pThr/pTyr-binding forkhead associated (FHA) protein